MTFAKQKATEVAASRDKNFSYYHHEADLPELPIMTIEFLEKYRGLPASKVQSHVLQMMRDPSSIFGVFRLHSPSLRLSCLILTDLLTWRERAWQIFPFLCLGSMRSLNSSLSSSSSCAKIPYSLSNRNDPKTLLDVGCCFGQDLRDRRPRFETRFQRFGIRSVYGL